MNFSKITDVPSLKDDYGASHTNAPTATVLLLCCNPCFRPMLQTRNRRISQLLSQLRHIAHAVTTRMKKCC